jgi:hypothetical protein
MSRGRMDVYQEGPRAVRIRGGSLAEAGDIFIGARQSSKYEVDGGIEGGETEASSAEEDA